VSEPPLGRAKPLIGLGPLGRLVGLLVPAGFAIVLIAYGFPFMSSSGSTLSGFYGFLLIEYFWSGGALQALEFFGPEILPVLLAVVGLLSQLDRGRGGLLIGLACSALGCIALFEFFGFVGWEHLDIHFDFGFYIATFGFLISALSSVARLLGQPRLVLRNESQRP